LPETADGDEIEVRVADRCLTLLIKKGTSRRPDHLILREVGFASEEAAWTAGKEAKAALRATGVAVDVPMDLGPDVASTGIGQIVKDQAREERGVDLRGDVHGVDVFEESSLEVHYVRMEAEGSVTANLDQFVETFSQFLTRTSGADIDDRVELAFEIYMAASFEATDRARFVTYITVLEILASRETRGQPALDVISNALSELDDRDDLEASAMSSLRSGLIDLQSESIGASIRSLVESIDTAQLDLGDRNVRRFISDCYEARSKLVHDGRIPLGFEIRIETPRLAAVAREVLLSHLASG
jgi:hypothetical protein